MKTMKKLIAISLTVVMLVALAIPAYAAPWKWNNTGRSSEAANSSNLIATEQQEIPLNAGALPAGTTVALGSETSDSDWQFAYPYTLNKKYTPGNYDGLADVDVYLMYDSEYLYVKEVRRGELRGGQYSVYTLLLSDVVMSTTSKTPVGAQVKVVSPFTAETTSGVVANTITSNTTNFCYVANGGENAAMRSTTAFSGVESYSRYVSDACFEIETKIPWSKVGSGLTAPAEGTLLGFKHYTYFGTGSANYHTASILGSGFHNEWDYYAPLYLRAENAEASTYVIDTTWYDANETEFVITTAGQLRGLAGLINSAANLDASKAVTAGKTFKLGANIALNPVSDVAYYYWTPMVTFDGTLDGQGYKISNMHYHYAWNTATMVAKNYDSCSRDAGFIAHIYGSPTIKNLIFTDATVVSNWAGGGLVGKIMGTANATFENLYINADVQVSNGANTNQDCGIFCGRLETGATEYLTNMVVTGSAKMTSTGGNYASPLWGRGSGAKSHITDVMVYDVTISSSKVSWGSYHGGNDTANKVDYYRYEGNALYDVAVNTNGKTAAQGYPEDWICADEANENIKMPAPVAEMISRNLWIQETAVNATTKTFNVRILSVIDSLAWDKLGLKVEMKVGDGEFVDISADIPDATAVYTSVVAAGETKEADKLGGKYMAAVVLSDISAEATVTFKVTPIKYVGETAYTNAHASTVTYVNGILQ